MASTLEKLHNMLDRSTTLAMDNPNAIYGGAAVVAFVGAYSLYSRKRSSKRKPTSFDLSLGSIGTAEGKTEFTKYSNAYGVAAGEGVREEERENVVKLVRFRIAPRRSSLDAMTSGVFYVSTFVTATRSMMSGGTLPGVGLP